MSIRQLYSLGAGLLALALLAAACDATSIGGQPPISVASPAPTQPALTAPPAPSATSVPAATATRAPSATAQPAATPTSAAPTSAPAATTEPSALLPTNAIWVRIANTIIAHGDQGRTLDLQARGFPPVMGRAVAAPDGSHIAYVDQQDRLTLLDMSGSARTLPDGRDIHPIGFRFSPDSRSLAFTVTDGQTWQLQIVDLRSGALRTLMDGSSMPTGDGPSLTPRPLAWTPAGLIVDRILWASDAPPSGLVLIDLADGSERVLSDGPHIHAFPAPDSTKIALVTGELRIGEPPSVAIKVLDVGSGSEVEVAPMQQGLVKSLRWSPDGAMLLYALSEDYESTVTSLIAVNADGTDEQRVDFGVAGFELPVHDLDWQDAKTPLVLVTNQAGRVELNALPLNSFDATGLRPLGTFEGDAGNQLPQILHVPRGI